MAQVDGVFPMDPNKSKGLEQRRDLADLPNIDQRCARLQADFCRCGLSRHLFQILNAPCPGRTGMGDH